MSQCPHFVSPLFFQRPYIVLALFSNVRCARDAKNLITETLEILFFFVINKHALLPSIPSGSELCWACCLESRWIYVKGPYDAKQCENVNGQWPINDRASLSVQKLYWQHQRGGDTQKSHAMSTQKGMCYEKGLTFEKQKGPLPGMPRLGAHRLDTPHDEIGIPTLLVWGHLLIIFESFTLFRSLQREGVSFLL